MSLVLKWTYCTLLLEPHRYYKFKIEKAKIHQKKIRQSILNHLQLTDLQLRRCLPWVRPVRHKRQITLMDTQTADVGVHNETLVSTC